VTQIRKTTISATACVFFLAIPLDAFAWGAGVHLQIGMYVLDNLAMLARSTQNILAACPYDFLYGCVSADITIGKKYTHYLKHCHSWRVAKQILAAAKNDKQRACALGYMCHLGADTVAHSYFVPVKMIRTFNTVLLKHTYWEMRYESLVDPEVWEIARNIAQQDFSDNDRMMRQVLANTLFSFSTNKRLFNSIMLLSRLQHWQKMLRSLSDNSKYPLGYENAEEYFDLARAASLSIISDPDNSPYLNADPTGENALEAGKMLRKNLNILWQEGKITDEEAMEYIEKLRPQFRNSITQPEDILTVLSAA
jgi:hypothetical protein